MSVAASGLISREAAYLRAALLLGLVHERDVSEWAQRRLLRVEATSRDASLLTELLLAEEMLSPMREALRPMESPVDVDQLVELLVAGIAIDDALAERSTADKLRVLELLKREFPLSPDLVGEINAFLERAMLAHAKIAVERSVHSAELQRWLDARKPTAYFRFEFDRRDEAAAFVAALSRKHDADRKLGPDTRRNASAWVSDDGEQRAIVLDHSGWRLAVREFAPLPIISRIPALSLPGDARVLWDGTMVEALGSEAAMERLHHLVTLSADGTAT